MKTRKKIAWGQVVLHAVFIIFSLCVLVPFAMAVAISFTDEAVLKANGYHLIPEKFSLAAYKLIFTNLQQLIWSYETTIIFTAVSTGLSVLIMSLMAYPLSRPNFKFRRPISFYVLFTMLFNGGLVPTYLLNVKYLHLNDTIWVYILPGLISAYYLFVIRTNYESIPNELIEAAKLEGASELYICFKIIMPLCKASIASVAFMFMVNKWNDWNTSLLYVRDMKLYSLQYLLQKLLNEVNTLKQMAAAGELPAGVTIPEEGYRYAMAILAAGPMLFVFPYFQKYFAKGIAIGGVKG